jgi:hypothetical protein
MAKTPLFPNPLRCSPMTRLPRWMRRTVTSKQRPTRRWPKPTVFQLENIETTNLLVNPLVPAVLNPLAFSPSASRSSTALNPRFARGDIQRGSGLTRDAGSLIPNREDRSASGGSSASPTSSLPLAKGESEGGSGQWTIWSTFDGGLPSIASQGGGGSSGMAPPTSGAPGAASAGANSAAGGGTASPAQPAPIVPPSGPTGGGAPAPQLRMAPQGGPPGVIITGGGGSVSAILPVLYDSTASDPQRELIQVNQAAQGGNPMMGAFSQSGVRYADGAIQLTAPDLTSTGFGNPFGQTRSWTNMPGYAAASYVGNGWVQNQSIFLQQQNSGNTLALVSSDANAKFFDLSGGTWTERYFLQDTLTDNTTTHVITVIDDTGKVLNFYDFNSSLPTAEQGTFKSITDQFGDTTSVTAHNANNQIQEIQSSSTVGSTTITESYLYTYVQAAPMPATCKMSPCVDRLMVVPGLI